jgi:hypothetical protein
MRVECHLIVSNNGSVRITKGLPSLNVNEIAIGVKLEIPNSYFTRPYPVVRIEVPDPAATPDPQVVIDLTASSVVKALQLDVDRVRDGITDLINESAERSDP